MSTSKELDRCQLIEYIVKSPESSNLGYIWVGLQFY